MCFALKAAEGLGVASNVFGKKFQGDEAMETGIFRLVDHAHAAATEPFDDAVMGNRLTDEVRGLRHAAILGLWRH